jgi:hypothetical protein
MVRIPAELQPDTTGVLTWNGAGGILVREMLGVPHARGADAVTASHAAVSVGLVQAVLRLAQPDARVLLVLFFLSGVSGLIYQVVWFRKVALIFGVTTYALGMCSPHSWVDSLWVGCWEAGSRSARAVT